MTMSTERYDLREKKKLINARYLLFRFFKDIVIDCTEITYSLLVLKLYISPIPPFTHAVAYEGSDKTRTETFEKSLRTFLPVLKKNKSVLRRSVPNNYTVNYTVMEILKGFSAQVAPAKEYQETRHGFTFTH